MIGTVQAAALALGFLFLSLYGGILENLEALLFGSFLGITTGQVRTLAAVAIAVLAFFAVAGRPLLYSSIDEPAADARGVPVRLLHVAFLVVLGLAVAATAQITGVLLVFALLVAPAAAAQQLTARIPLSLALTVAVRAGDHLDRADARLLRQLLASASTSRRSPSRSTSSAAAAAQPSSGCTSGRRARQPRARRRRPAVFAHEFIRNALLAGTPIALACGAVGYFVVLRAQVFAGDALSHVAFTGALAAAAAGIDLRIGLFAATVLVAALLAAIGQRAAADDVMIGIVFVWVLGLGVFFLDLFNRGVHGGNGTVASRTLFGSIFALTTGQARLAALIGFCVLLAIVVIARPLLFATIDPQVAAARGVPVGLVGAALLILLGIDAAEATQAVGALLLLGLIAAPAGAAVKLTAHPYLGARPLLPASRSPRSGSASPPPT